MIPCKREGEKTEGIKELRGGSANSYKKLNWSGFKDFLAFLRFMAHEGLNKEPKRPKGIKKQPKTHKCLMYVWFGNVETFL